jgi:hypothetical protein
VSVLSFTSRHLGSFVTAPGGVGHQCVDLANLYLLEEYRAPHQYLNAKDWVHASIPGWAWVANTPLNVPPAGALVVWGPYAPLSIGQYGHIALVLVADVNRLVSTDQDWPFGAPCTLQLHTYGGVLGWQLPQPVGGAS